MLTSIFSYLVALTERVNKELNKLITYYSVAGVVLVVDVVVVLFLVLAVGFSIFFLYFLAVVGNCRSYGDCRSSNDDSSYRGPLPV